MRAAHRVAAAVLLAGLVVGIPALLVAIAGWPLPKQLPDGDAVVTAFRQGDLPADVVIKTLAGVVWVCWVQVVWALAWETVTQLRHPFDPPAQHPAPLVSRRVHLGVGRLVAFLLTASVTIAAPARTLTAATSTPVVGTGDPPQPLPALTAPPVASTPTAVWVVAAGDTVWDIAQTALGDGGRASEILELNPQLGSPRSLRPGQQLRLAADATIPDDRRPAPAEPVAEEVSASTVTIEVPGYLPPTTITVKTGDNLWDLSDARLDDADGPATHPTQRQIAGYLDDVIAANHFPSGNPSLIYTGESYTFPAIGTPPPPPPAPPPGPAQPDTSPPASAASSTSAPATAAVSPDSAAPVERQDPPTESTMLPAPPSATAPAATATARATTAGDDHDDRGGVIAGIAGATVLATGLLLAYRQRRQRAGIAGARQLSRRPTGRHAAVVAALVRAADVPLVRWANHELAALMARLRPNQITGTPLVVELSERHGLELLWDTPQAEAPAPWEAADAGWTWRLLYDPDLPLPHQPEIPPLPGLATIGTRDGNTVLVNLEALGVVAVIGDANRAEDFVRAVVLELGAGEDLANACTTVVGLTVDGNQHLWRTEHGDTALACTRLRTIQDSYRNMLKTSGHTTAFQTRLGASSGDGEIYLAALCPDDATKVLERQPVQPNLGAAVLVVGDTATAHATITIDASGAAILQPLGLNFKAVGVSSTTASDIAEVLHEGRSPTPDPPETKPELAEPAATVLDDNLASEGRAEDEPVDVQDCDDEHHSFQEPAHFIRVLGVPRVQGTERIGPLELGIVTFLACKGGSATPDQVIDAVWGGKAIERGTFLNRLTKTRNAFPGMLLGRTNGTRDLSLADDVGTDLDLFEKLVEQARHEPSSEASALLTQALALVDGVPFDDATFDWAHDRQHHAHACQLIEAATLRLVVLALDEQDIDLAREACRRGLIGLPLNEPIYCARMRVEAAAGNRSGIERAFRDLRAGLNDLGDRIDSYKPSPETVKLYEQLTGTISRRSTA